MRRPAIAAAGLLLATACPAAYATDGPGVRLDGAVQHEATLSLADLKTMPSVRVDMSSKGKSGIEQHGWTGVLLWNLLGKAGWKTEPGKHTELRHVLMVHGADGYVVAVAVGEIDPIGEGKQVILATSEVGAAGDLSAPRLVVPGDLHGARQVHDVTEIEVK